MIHLFTVKGELGEPSASFEQDVKVTTKQTKDVVLKEGDRVQVLAYATVESVYGTGGQREVKLSKLQATKVLGVDRD